MREFTLLAAYLSDGTPLSGIPGQHDEGEPNSWGDYHASFPQTAASKAYSNVQKYMKKYKEPWFTDIELNQPLILVLHETSDRGEKRGPAEFIYYVFRETAMQSQNGPRVVVNDQGRVRKYMWKNRAVPMKENETPDQAIEKYHTRRTVAQRRKGSFGTTVRGRNE